MDPFYLRQISYIGLELQEKIENTTICIIGCGGLGSPLAHLAVRMGFKEIILIDGDTVQKHNLSRQHLYTLQDCEKKKVRVLKEKLLEIQPNTTIHTHEEFIRSVDDFKELPQADIYLDGLDTHHSRTLLDNWCKSIDKPWIHGSAIQEIGMVGIITEKTYQDIYGENPKETHCADTGVLVTTTTTVASFQLQLLLRYLQNTYEKNTLYRIHLEMFSITKIKTP